RQPADLEKLRRGEEDHLRRKAVDRIDEDALLEHLVVEAALLAGNGGRQPRGPGADDDDVANRHTADDNEGRKAGRQEGRNSRQEGGKGTTFPAFLPCFYRFGCIEPR